MSSLELLLPRQLSRETVSGGGGVRFDRSCGLMIVDCDSGSDVSFVVIRKRRAGGFFIAGSRMKARPAVK